MLVPVYLLLLWPRMARLDCDQLTVLEHSFRQQAGSSLLFVAVSLAMWRFAANLNWVQPNGCGPIGCVDLHQNFSNFTSAIRGTP
jgi:hypothetical protein